MADMEHVMRRLSEDPLYHVVLLKMLNLYPQQAELHFAEDGSVWSVLAVFPASVSEFDKRAYSAVESMAVVDGNSESSMLRLLEQLPKSALLLKTRHRAIARRALASGGRLERTFISFTTERRPRSVPGHVSDGDEFDAEIARAFGHVGNDVEFLSHAFRQRRARWFAVRRGGDIRSACVVYQNFASIWEVAGLFTRAEWRRQGLARNVVRAALDYLLMKKLQPRYQADSANFASLDLARSLGLAEFLRVDHVMLPVGRVPRDSVGDGSRGAR